ncbi:MAG: EamA family transporter [Kiritimatiellae bacterium]|nr:EamA family transporter [Kiritimatiellia bacterium]
MAWPAVVLILISAFTHTVWNSIAKKCDTSAAFFGLAMLASVLAFLPASFYCLPLVPHLPLKFWVILLATALFQAGYYYFLGKGYRHGEMSIVYPIARSYPVIVVTLVMFLFGQTPTWPALAGVVMIVGGCFLIQLRRFREWDWRRFGNLAAFFAFLSALAAAGYSICDKIDMDAVVAANTMLARPRAGVVLPLFYNWLINIPLCLVLLSSGLRDRARFRASIRQDGRRAAAVGLLSFGTYGLVLGSMRFVTNVSYVVAFRQISILFTVGAGILFLGEKRYPPKIAAAIIIFAGLALVGLFGK